MEKKLRLKTRQYFTLVCLIGLTFSTLAERWYEVEVILFEQATEERLNSESWEQLPPLPDVSTSRDFLTQAAHERPINEVCIDGRLFSVDNKTTVTVLPELDLNQQLLPDQAIDLNEALALEMYEELDSEPEKPFKLLSRDERELNAVYAQLRRRRGYRMLFHEAWRQPMASKRESLPIRIYAGQDYGQQFNYAGDAIVELAETDNNNIQTFGYLTELNPLAYQQQVTQQRFNTAQTIAPMMDMDAYFKRTRADDARDALNECADTDRKVVEKQRPAVWQVDGYIRLYAERFRHIETNLVLRIPGQEEINLRALATTLAADEMLANIDMSEPSQPASIFNWELSDDFLSPAEDPETLTREILRYYSFQQSRRITDEKIHYFDHPLLGMIVQMRSYDPEQDENDS